MTQSFESAPPADSVQDIPPHRLTNGQVAQRLAESGFAFTPIPVRPRGDGWNVGIQQRFVLTLAATGSVGLSLQMVGRSRQSMHNLKARPDADSFNAAFDAALSAGQCRVVDQALAQARDGVFNVRVSPTGRVTVRRQIDYRLIETVLGERGMLRDRM
jgi:hypothetical protein